MPIIGNFPSGSGGSGGGLALAAVSGIQTLTAAGKVYELTVPKSRQASIQNEYCVLSSQGHLADVRIRVLHDSEPTVGDPVTCEATVEDGYMEMLRQLERGVKK